MPTLPRADCEHVHSREHGGPRLREGGQRHLQSPHGRTLPVDEAAPLRRRQGDLAPSSVVLACPRPRELSACPLLSLRLSQASRSTPCAMQPGLHVHVPEHTCPSEAAVRPLPPKPEKRPARPLRVDDACVRPALAPDCVSCAASAPASCRRRRCRRGVCKATDAWCRGCRPARVGKRAATRSAGALAARKVGPLV
eukprot:scaffold2360_cov380-Prasinococcus_capsulatus_cf.AAC.3